jgi:hypothetical protein
MGAPGRRFPHVGLGHFAAAVANGYFDLENRLTTYSYGSRLDELKVKSEFPTGRRPLLPISFAELPGWKRILEKEGLGMRIRKAKLAAKLFPWHIGLLDMINQNALVGRWIAEQRGPPSKTCTISIAMFMARYAAEPQSISSNSASTRDTASDSGRR